MPAYPFERVYLAMVPNGVCVWDTQPGMGRSDFFCGIDISVR